MTCGGRVAQPSPLVARPLDGTTSYEEVRREDDELLSQIRVETTTTLEGLIHMMAVDRVTCIVFSDDDLPPEGSEHTCHLYIKVGCSGHRFPSAVLDNGSALNVYPLATSIALGYAPLDFEPMLKISHSEDDIFLTGFTFDEVQTLEHGPMEFVATVNHDTPFRLGFVSIEADYRYMARLRKERRLEIQTHMGDFGTMINMDGVDELQHQFHHLQLEDKTSGAPISVMIAHSSPDQASFLSLCFPEETTDYGVVIEPTEVIDGVVPHDEYRDEMDMMSMSQISKMVQPEPASPFDLFRVSAIEVTEEIQTVLTPELMEDVIVGDELCEDTFSFIEGASESVDLPLSFDILSRFISYSNDIFDIDDEIAQPDLDRDSFYHDSDPIDEKDSPDTRDIETVDFGTEDQPREPKIGSPLSTDERGYNKILMAPEGMRRQPLLLSGSRSLAALEKFFERIRKFILRLNPEKCTFGVTSRKLLGHMVSEWGIEVNPDKIKVILNMPVQRIEKEIRGFLGRKNQTTVWNDGCQIAFEKIKGYLLSPPVLVPPMPRRPLLLYLLVSDMVLGCMLAQEIEALHDRVFSDLDFLPRSIECVSQKTIKGSIVVDHLASLSIFEGKPVDDDFLDDEFITMISLSNDIPPRTNIVEYEACILGLETTLELGIRQMEVFGDSNLVLRKIHGDWRTKDVKLRSYHAYLELLVGRFDDLRYTHLPRAQNQFADALAALTTLATLASSMNFLTNVDDLPLYHDVYRFLRSGTYPEATTTKDQRALRQQLSTRFVICGEALYSCGPHMGGHMLACKIMRTGYFWLTMETDCCQFVQKCPECQIHGDLIHAPPSDGHEFILVAIDYFTKWVEAAWPASYARLTSARVASFIRPQTNGAVKAANKNIKRILRKMVETPRDWSKKLHFALWVYRTSFRTFTGTISYSLVYGMKTVLPVETDMGEKRLRATDHVQAYQRKMTHAFKKWVKTRPLQKGDLVLRILRGLVGDLRGKFLPS
ncbi:hypothetical protein CK203_091933 [Vitis vinifera]|uniref:RNase H type-1 domain-containing protein n=1 Tax=Vitis vinifera TaxID=29760 RepID=A0A438BRL0_VITVI|nr:hypothetical protein CK203_091933 [Vitis vinifera]